MVDAGGCWGRKMGGCPPLFLWGLQTSHLPRKERITQGKRILVQWLADKIYLRRKIGETPSQEGVAKMVCPDITSSCVGRAVMQKCCIAAALVMGRMEELLEETGGTHHLKKNRVVPGGWPWANRGPVSQQKPAPEVRCLLGRKNILTTWSWPAAAARPHGKAHSFAAGLRLERY